MMQPPKEDSFHHSVLGCRDARYSSELIEIGGPTYTLYVDVREDRWTSLFLSTVRELQEAFEDVYANGSSTSIVEISIPIASFRPRSLEALDGLTKILDREIREFIQEQASCKLQYGWRPFTREAEEALTDQCQLLSNK